MIKAKFVTGGNVAPGTTVHLSFEQADARGHLLQAAEDRHKDAKDKRRLPFVAAQALYFKAGEEIGVEGAIDRHLQTALDLSDEDVVKLGAAKPGLKAKVAARRRRNKKAEVEAAEAIAAAQKAVDEAEAAHAAEADPEKRVPLLAALDAAKAALVEAQQAAA